MNQSVTLTIDPSQSLGSIAVNMPGATAVFRRLKLDYCCGGNKSLKDALSEKNLNIDAVVNELSTLTPGEAPERFASTDDLIDHILSRYHETHRAQLPELIRMARRVEAVHADHPDTPAGLADLLSGIQEEMLSHMQKEEQVLFPMLRTGGNDFVVHPIQMMRSEHNEHGKQLEQLMKITHDATPPQGACTTWRALYSGIARFQDDLIQHIHLENNTLFPRFEPASRTTGGQAACACHG